MPARPWFALNPGDYLRDTQALSLEEHGAYIRLLCHAWNHDGEIPKDARRLGNILGVHTNKAKTLWGFVCGFWYETPTGFRQNRMDRELAYAAEISAKRAEAGKRGGQASAEAKAQASGLPSYNPQSTVRVLLNTKELVDFPETDPSKGNGELAPKPAAPRIARAAIQAVYDDLNRRTRRTFRAYNPDGSITAGGEAVKHWLRRGYTLQDFQIVHSRKCNEWQDDPKMCGCLNPTTLYRASHFPTYRGMSEAPEGDA